MNINHFPRSSSPARAERPLEQRKKDLEESLKRFQDRYEPSPATPGIHPAANSFGGGNYGFADGAIDVIRTFSLTATGASMGGFVATAGVLLGASSPFVVACFAVGGGLGLLTGLGVAVGDRI